MTPGKAVNVNGPNQLAKAADAIGLLILAKYCCRPSSDIIALIWALEKIDDQASSGAVSALYLHSTM